MEIKTLIEWAVEEKRDKIIDLSNAVFDLAELGFREKKTVAKFVEVLRGEGFDVEEGLDEMPTAFRASYGTGQPVIAYLAEYDALPELSQQAGSAKRCAAEGANPDGHGCGHNLLGAGCLAAALALKSYLEENPGKGTVALFGCPSEEKGNAKTFLARDGYFDGVDVGYSWHPMDVSGIAGYSSLANVSAFFRFNGTASHAAAAPEKGRSALDAAELMSVGVNYLREHIIPEARVHYAYRDAGGIAPNVVQSSSCVHYMIRAPKLGDVQEIFDRVRKVAQGAALMTETEMSVELYSGVSEFLPNHIVSESVFRAMEAVGMPQFNEEERRWARDFFKASDVGEALEKKIRMVRNRYGEEKLAFPVDDAVRPIDWGGTPMAASTDVGDASQVMPMALLVMGSAVMGTAAHTWQMTAQGKSPIALKMMLQAGKILALSGAEMCTHPELVQMAKEERDKANGGHYLSPIPADLKPRLEDEDCV